MATTGVGVLAAALLLLGISRLPRQQREASAWIVHTFEVLNTVSTLQVDLIAAVSEGRGFAFDATQEGKWLFDAHRLKVDQDLDLLRTLTADNPLQQSAIARLAPLIAARLDAVRDIMLQIEAGDRDGALRRVRTLHGHALMDQSNVVIAGITAEENQLLAQRNKVAHDTARWTLAGLIACGIAVTASVLFAVGLMVNRLREGKHIDELQRINAELEDRVAARTAEVMASEAQLREREASFRLLAEHASDMVSRVGPDGERSYVSPASVRIFGETPEAMLGSGLLRLIWLEDRPAVDASMQRLLSGAVEEDRVAFRVPHRDGADRWIEASARALRNPVTGAPDGYVAISRDVTERRLLDAERQVQANELLAANAELERLARHLARARDGAERANRAKSRFLAGMSHELRTPLNGILGYAHLLRLDGALSPLQDTRVNAMLDAGRHLLDMINRVLTLSEIEAGHVEGRMSEVDLDQIARECLELMRPVAEAKGLALGLDAPATLRTLTTDPTHLRQVLLNLLGNAVKFTVQGAVHLHIRPGPDGAAIRLEVADTGPGIPVERRSKLFQEFERLSEDPTTIEGAGLGLAFADRLAVSMGGRLGYRDNVGGGSIFWLELPLADATPGVAPEVALVADDLAPATMQEAPSPLPLRVLVVDDMAMNRDIASSFLRAVGHEVTCVEGGADAVAAANANDFDIILMDLRMPGMDGLEATRRIRAQPGLRGQVPIVALTAQVFAEQVKECHAAGMDDHLAKPFTPDDLAAAVGRVAGAGKARAVTEAALGAAPEAAPEAVVELPALGWDLPVLDMAVLERTAAFLPPESVVGYLRTIMERGEDLRRRLVSLDAAASKVDELAAPAHTLAGSAGMFGCERLATVARHFELAAQAASPGARALAISLAGIIEASCLQLADYLRSASAKTAAPAGSMVDSLATPML